MSAFASIEPPDLALGRGPAQVGVYRYQPSGPSPFQYLPNVRVLAIRYREGPDPGLARFRYVFSPADPTTDPTSFQQALSSDCDLKNVVQNDERLVVVKYNPGGSTDCLFDGFAQVPELSLSPNQELVTFVAYGTAVRAWDTPIGGALFRDADDPTLLRDAATDLPTYFNPGGRPNATPAGYDSTGPNGNTYASFLDPLVVRNPDLRRKWTLPMAVRYLCFRHNPGEEYVLNPDPSVIDALLDSRSPAGGVQVNPSAPGQFQSNAIVVPDYPATGKPWPVALHELLEPNGFGMVFRLEADGGGNPRTRLELFRRQDASTSSYKDVYLQPWGQELDPGLTNLSGARLARDTSGVANVFAIASAPLRYEASFVLAPGFPIKPADAADTSALRAYDRGDPSFSLTNRDNYRLYVFDETGEGHWDFAAAVLKTKATDLAALLGGSPDRPSPVVKRRRPPSGELFTTDANRKPLKARLAISTDYAGVKPGLWDGTGTWQSVVGGYELLQDRLGIWVQVPNPNGWNIGVPTAPGMPYPSGVVRGVEDQANPSATHFTLRLTCVIEGDSVVKATAGKRPSSSSAYAITRRLDASDRFAMHVVAAQSEFNPTNSPVVARDDTPDALSEACARRLAGEAGEVAGSLSVPRFTAAYRIGDKVRSIQGRNLLLRTNAGAPADEGEVYPSVVGMAWDFDGRQTTALELSDHRGGRS